MPVRTSAWLRLTLLSLIEIVHSGSRPTVVTCSPSEIAFARRQHERSGAEPAGGLLELGEDAEAAGLSLLSTSSSTLTGPMKW